MPTVLAPHGDDNRYSQDSFASELFARFGFAYVKKRPNGYALGPRGLDLLISHNPHELEDALCLTRHRDAPSVVHLHYHPEYCRDLDALAMSLKHADAGIVPTQFLKLKMAALWPNVDWHVVCNGVRRHLFFPSARGERLRFRRSLGIPDLAVLLGFVGRITPVKGLELLEDMCRRIHETNACLLIQFPYWHNSEDPGERERHLAYVNRLRGFNPARVFAYPDRAPRLPDRPMRHLDGLLMPSFSELQPMVVLEALVCGVPIIGTMCSPCYDELPAQGVPASAFRLVELPERFAQGANAIESLQMSERQMLSAAFLRLIAEHRPVDDQDRQALAGRISTEFTDATMYQRWEEIYRRYRSSVSSVGHLEHA